jgi:UDP-GlcNAc:undecaprenyl-phosphate GlcNAc-1-phosphate transferase
MSRMGMGKVKLVPSLLLAPVVAAVLSAVLIPFARRLACQLEWVAKPAKDRLHTAPVPLLGGVAVMVAFAGVAGSFGAPTWLLFGALVLCVVGLVDDIVSLAPRTKVLWRFL